MSEPLELEIHLYRRDSSSYHIELRLLDLNPKVQQERAPVRGVVTFDYHQLRWESPEPTFSSDAVLGWRKSSQLRTALMRSCFCSYSKESGRRPKKSSQLLQGTGSAKGDGNGAAGITA